MLKAIRHGLASLTTFEGRDARQPFWYYVLFVYIALVVISILAIVPITFRIVFEGIQAGFAASEAADPPAADAMVAASVAGAMGDMMTTMLWLSVGSGVLALALLAAAFVRRLHDSGLSGGWALIPGAAYVANVALAPATMRSALEAFAQVSSGNPAAQIETLQGAVTLTSVLGWLAIIAVVVLGVRKSSEGPNRYGEAPFVA